MNKALSLIRREAFCLAYVTGSMNGSQAALAAGYAQPNPKNAHITAWYLLRQPAVKARLKELREAIASDTIMTVTQRKERLSEIARAHYDDPERDGDPIRAVEVLNLMEGFYSKRGKMAPAVPKDPAEVRERIAEELNRREE